MKVEEDIEIFEKNGFIIVRDFFSSSEVENIKKLADKWEQYLKNPCCIGVYEESDSIFCNPRVYGLVKELIGDEPIYFGDGNITPNVGESSYSEGSGMFHKDCVDRSDYTKPDWSSRYTGIRLGIYTSNHTNSGGGIAFRRGSHIKPFVNDRFYRRKPLIFFVDFLEMMFGRSVYADIKPGDLVIWKLTTDHSGNATKLRFMRNRPITKFTNFIPRFLRVPVLSDLRVAMFVTFGSDDKHLERFIAAQKKRRYQVESWLSSDYSGRIENNRLGLFKLRDVGSELRNGDEKVLIQSLNENWQPE